MKRDFPKSLGKKLGSICGQMNATRQRWPGERTRDLERILAKMDEHETAVRE